MREMLTFLFKDLKVFWPVVSLTAVFMMYNLSWQKVPAEHFSGNEPVIKHVLFRADSNILVPVTSDIPVSKFNVGGVSTSGTAELSFLRTLKRERFSTMRALGLPTDRSVVSLIASPTAEPRLLSPVTIFGTADFTSVQHTVLLSKTNDSSIVPVSDVVARRIKVRATGYCPNSCCCGSYANGKTATGRSAWVKGVAVDRSKIPLGARLDIPGYGNWVLADDVGGAIKGNKIDVRFRTHKEALKWGVRTITVRIWVKKTVIATQPRPYRPRKDRLDRRPMKLCVVPKRVSRLYSSMI